MRNGAALCQSYHSGNSTKDQVIACYASGMSQCKSNLETTLKEVEEKNQLRNERASIIAQLKILEAAAKFCEEKRIEMTRSESDASNEVY